MMLRRPREWRCLYCHKRVITRTSPSLEGVPACRKAGRYGANHWWSRRSLVYADWWAG